MSGSKLNLLAAIVALVFGAMYQFMPVVSRDTSSGFDTETFGSLPALYAGRHKPIDSIARNSLLVVSGRQSVKDGEDRLDAVNWFLELASKPGVASARRVFRIDHPGILAVLNLSHLNTKRFSFNEIVEKGKELQEQLNLANSTPQNQRSLFQRKILTLGEQLGLFQSINGLNDIKVVPTADGDAHWLALHDHDEGRTAAQEELGTRFAAALQAYGIGDETTFNAEVVALHELYASQAPNITVRASREQFLNQMELFPRAAVLYVISAIMMLVSWLKWGSPLLSASTSLVLFALIMHTVGLIARVYLSGRPPVTNLYSSAIFIGWGTVAICVYLEYLFRNGMGIITAATIGFMSLLVAKGLSGNGDTMAVLQAVLDTNFWLATHVVVITLGYAATYLAGFLGIAYVLRGVLTKSLTADDAKRLGQMIYGVVCFATLLSFIGTILGGIWADQSWGRFWGWDPKENGALIIVLWNALILHARWGGLVRHRGLAVLAIFGNIVTSWSWFGVNMLGKGLHSYGFMDSAAFWLTSFVFVQLFLVALGLFPRRTWRSRPWGELPAAGSAT